MQTLEIRCVNTVTKKGVERQCCGFIAEIVFDIPFDCRSRLAFITVCRKCNSRYIVYPKDGEITFKSIPLEKGKACLKGILNVNLD